MLLRRERHRLQEHRLEATGDKKYAVKQGRHPLQHVRWWTEAERRLCSCWRELAVVEGLLKLFSWAVDRTEVLLYTDTGGIVNIYQCETSRSRRPDLQLLTDDIRWYTSWHGISLTLLWVPRELNKQADRLPRVYRSEPGRTYTFVLYK